ncbi:MAG TPA: DUF5690 family protein, partial [Polyangiaceae bacterium]|nr:DUF5690 family protein [Polyangiaceae bacterium]
VLTTSEIPVAIGALAAVGLCMAIKNNRSALLAIHGALLLGSLLVGVSTVMFELGVIGPAAWMVLVGIGLYIGYVPYNCVLFDRLIPAVGHVGTAGFLIYVTDAFGYLGSVVLLLYKNFGEPQLSWLTFFKSFSHATAWLGALLFVVSTIYFAWRTRAAVRVQAAALFLLLCVGCVPKPPETPRLVVAVVIDQLPSWALDKYLPHLPENGVLRRGIARGTFIERARFGYARTNTAPGHASIFTGAPPSQSGITSNSIYDDASAGEQPFVSDRRHRVHGRTDATASPLMLRVETVGDVLERETRDRAWVVSLAVKDRSAILSGGKRADVAVWFDHRIPAFTTSSYYGAPPAWLARWQSAQPSKNLLQTWRPYDAELSARAAGRDDGAGEGDWLGLGRTFPHRIGETKEPYGVARTAPVLTERLMSLARRAVTELDLGGDDIVDLLAISIAGTDYAGHTFGPDSWEYFDNLLRADRALGGFVRWLEARGPIAVLITSDHGVARLPEQLRQGGRVYPDQLVATAERAVRDALPDRAPPPRGWVRAFVRPFFYLAPELEGEARARAKRAIVEHLGFGPGIHMLVDVDEGQAWSHSANPLLRSVGLSLARGAPGDVYVMPSSGWVIDEGMPRGAGTTHGTPWSFDAEVPVIFWGPGVAQKRVRGPLGEERVAATLAALLGVPLPRHLRAAPLPGLKQ